MSEFEQRVVEWTRPVNGQYPRPWTSRTMAPSSARVFLVGRNQATPFNTSAMTHTEVVDALLCRGSVSLDALYLRARGDKGSRPSRTRLNIEAFVNRLRSRGIDDVLETNVVCYSTSMSSDLNRDEHTEGKRRGRQIFSELLTVVQPSILIAHGAGTLGDLSRSLGDQPLAAAPATLESGVSSTVVALPKPADRDVSQQVLVISMPSLAPPGWNRWSRWAHDHHEAVAEAVAANLRELRPAEPAPLNR